MAFTLENLTIVTNNTKSGVVPSLWVYYNEDNDVVTTSEFMEEARLTVGDQVLVLPADYSAGLMYRVSAKSTDTFKATLVVIASQQANPNAFETSTAVTAFYDTLSVANEASLLVSTAAVITDVYTASATTNYITCATKQLTDNMLCTVTTTDTAPGGLAVLTNYYTVNASGYTAQLSATLGGAAIDITDAGTGVQTLSGSVNNFVLPDGAEGQRKIVKFKTDGTLDAVLIPDNLLDGTTITFGTALEFVELVFANSTWNIVNNSGGVVA